MMFFIKGYKITIFTNYICFFITFVRGVVLSGSGLFKYLIQRVLLNPKELKNEKNNFISDFDFRSNDFL